MLRLGNSVSGGEDIGFQGIYSQLRPKPVWEILLYSIIYYEDVESSCTCFEKVVREWLVSKLSGASSGGGHQFLGHRLFIKLKLTSDAWKLQLNYRRNFGLRKLRFEGVGRCRLERTLRGPEERGH